MLEWGCHVKQPVAKTEYRKMTEEFVSRILDDEKYNDPAWGADFVKLTCGDLKAMKKGADLK